MRKIYFLLCLFLFFTVFPSKLFAQSPSPTVVEDTTTTDSGEEIDRRYFTTDPPQTPTKDSPSYYISDLSPTVTVSFPNLEPGGEYYICLRTDYCLKNWAIAQVSFDKLVQLARTIGFDPKDINEKALKKSSDIFKEGNFIKVCGKGESELKTDCKDGRDYFHAGHFYLITIYQKQDHYVDVSSGGFYVSHGNPTVTIDPSTSIPKKTSFKVSLQQSVIKPGGGNRNNYQIVLEGPGGYHREQCTTISNDKNPQLVTFPYRDDSEDVVKNGFTLEGNYLFKINEQNNEGGNNVPGFDDNCQGGYTYMHITCTISSNPAKSKCQQPVYDPHGDDAKELLELLNVLNGVSKQGVPLPCNKQRPFVTNPLDCDSIDTSIGPIALNPVGFITRLFSIVLTFAGIGAMILIIFSGYRLLLSRGNKELIQGARQTLTSAITGLIFIIFSLVILSVIAGDILKIPGFK